MAGNRIFRGPTDRQFRTVSKPVAGAYLPGTFVEETATQLAQITTAVAKRPLLLMNVDHVEQGVADAYTSGDTGLGIELEPGMVVQARVAAATYAKGAPLTVAASGRLAAATTGTVVVAFFDDVPGAKSAGDLVDVVIANSYTVPA